MKIEPMKWHRLPKGSKYKYILDKPWTVQTGVFGYDIRTEFIRLVPSGLMTLARRYAWDGATGARDSNFIEGSGAHDAGYQLTRLGLIPKRYRKAWDRMMRRINKAFGMSGLRQFYTYWVVRMLGWWFSRRKK